MSQEYWDECISIAFEEAGITATKKQIELVAADIASGHDNYGMAHGYDCIPNPLEADNKRLAQELKTEKEKVFCKDCNGTGTEYSQGPYHCSISSCWKCNGEGKVKP